MLCFVGPLALRDIIEMRMDMFYFRDYFHGNPKGVPQAGRSHMCICQRSASLYAPESEIQVLPG